VPLSLPALKKRARKIRYFLFDVDGVLTDGMIIHGVAGGTAPFNLETKQFHVRDGFALKAARRMGFGVGLLSARQSAVTALRARELELDDCLQARLNKSAVLDELLAARSLDAAEVAYMGDDLIDLAVLRRCGLSAAPADAHDEIHRAVHHRTRAPGGRGAAREWFEQVLKWRGEYRGYVAQAIRDGGTERA
jgi:3-deoxy-D-manno-octulosonate 8-phosphate phosphatase (KDO 8-P phosphatase)